MYYEKNRFRSDCYYCSIYKKVIYACEESQLIKENVEALSLTEETPQQPDISTCVSAKNVTCIALHPTDPSKDKEVANKKWPNK